jgi:DNA-directed RNA polymerase subunit RPC12/RpoP
MAKCPKCGNEVCKPTKTLDNEVFRIQEYNCEKCNHKFIVSN